MAGKTSDNKDWNLKFWELFYYDYVKRRAKYNQNSRHYVSVGITASYLVDNIQQAVS